MKSLFGWIGSLFRPPTGGHVKPVDPWAQFEPDNKAADPPLFEPVPMMLIGVGRFIVRVCDIDSHYVYARICEIVDVRRPLIDPSLPVPAVGEDWWLKRKLCVFDPPPDEAGHVRRIPYFPKAMAEGAYEGSLLSDIREIGRKLGRRLARHEEEVSEEAIAEPETRNTEHGTRRRTRGFSNNHTTTPRGRH